MHFRMRGLPAELFLPLAGLTDQELAVKGVQRLLADGRSGFPDRVALRDARAGEHVLLMNYEHQPAASPFRASHAIFVIEGERETFDAEDVVPDALRTRVLSLRAFDDAGMIVGGELVDGREVEGAIESLLAGPETAYLHVHYAKYGCYAARVDRIEGEGVNPFRPLPAPSSATFSPPAAQTARREKSSDSLRSPRPPPTP